MHLWCLVNVKQARTENTIGVCNRDTGVNPLSIRDYSVRMWRHQVLRATGRGKPVACSLIKRLCIQIHLHWPQVFDQHKCYYSILTMAIAVHKSGMLCLSRLSQITEWISLWPLCAAWSHLSWSPDRRWISSAPLFYPEKSEPAPHFPRE